ncbi:transposase domain-containing protein [Aliivibrio sp. S4TY2]|uniref:transposase domain-containing protein n=1 Tax=unclassified Aliivibrio TaxID=2645654 RepID=UPI003FCC7AB0
MGLMRNRSISNVCDKLELASLDAKGDLLPLTTSSIVKARQRSGCKPLRYLFHITAS